MGPEILVLIGIIVGLIFWVSNLYNGLVRVQNACKESWSDIDTELKRRYDLVPNLVNVVKGYASHESELIERVVQARSMAMNNESTGAEKSFDENLLAGSLRQLIAVAEAYPDLKANQTFLKLQSELVTTEDRIQRARRFYNGNVRDLNNRVEIFPSNLIASSLGIQKWSYFEIEDSSVRETPSVQF